MEFVEPIRDKALIEDMKNQLLKRGSRDLMLFSLGINSGLRISDILKLKVKDVRDKTHLLLREEKTGKTKRFLLNANIRDQLNKYINKMKDYEYLFQSRQGSNSPLSRIQAYRIINEAAKFIGIQDRIGTHTLRKTFGYHHYQQYKDIAVLQQIFNHSAPSVTLRYIGINSDIIDKSIEDFSL